MMHAASVSAHNLIQFLSQPGIPGTFHTVIFVLTTGCNRWTIVRGIVRTLWITIKERKLERFLQESTIHLLKLNAVEKWGIADHLLFVSCSYPNYATSSVRGRDIDGIGDLLRSYARLNLNSKVE